jgi:methionyl-tRNA formyltransferase
MKVVALVAAERGVRCLRKIISKLTSQDNLIVFSFNETRWEPPFTKNLQELAESSNSSFYKTSKVHAHEYHHVWEDQPDIIIVIGWRYLIPQSVFNSARIGCFVFHDSYLPEYRGFGPTVWALRNGEKYTGATLFKIVEEMDAGPILEQRKIPIDAQDYIGDVVNRVTETYINMIESLFDKIAADDIVLVEQDHKKATYTCKSLPSDFKICWNSDADSIRNMIRAYSPPYPGSYCFCEGKKITVLKADVDKTKKYVGYIPGRVIRIDKSIGVYIATSNGLLLIRDVRVNDGAVVNASKIINKISMTLE